MKTSLHRYIAGITSAQVYRGKCYLVGLVVSGDGADGTLQVYDSQGNETDQLLHIGVKSGETVTYRPMFPLFLDRGLYVTVNVSTTKATVEYLVSVDDL